MRRGGGEGQGPIGSPRRKRKKLCKYYLDIYNICSALDEQGRNGGQGGQQGSWGGQKLRTVQ